MPSGVSEDDPLSEPQFRCPFPGCGKEFAALDACARHIASAAHGGARCAVCGAVLLTDALVAAHAARAGHAFRAAIDGAQPLGADRAAVARRLALRPLPLPPFWERRVDAATGREYFVDHRNRRTSAAAPSPSPQPLPAADEGDGDGGSSCCCSVEVRMEPFVWLSAQQLAALSGAPVRSVRWFVGAPDAAVAAPQPPRRAALVFFSAEDACRARENLTFLLAGLHTVDATGNVR